MVAVNTFYGERPHTLDAVRAALKISDHVPMVFCDARSRDETKQTLAQLVEHALFVSRASVG